MQHIQAPVSEKRLCSPVPFHNNPKYQLKSRKGRLRDGLMHERSSNIWLLRDVSSHELVPILSPPIGRPGAQRSSTLIHIGEHNELLVALWMVCVQRANYLLRHDSAGTKTPTTISFGMPVLYMCVSVFHRRSVAWRE